MDEIRCPFYRVEYYGTYISAIWAYEDYEIDDHFYTDNPGEEIAMFACESDAREFFKRHGRNKMSFWYPPDSGEDDPELGIGYFLVVRYDNWNDIGTVIEKSKGKMTRRQMQNFFKKEADIDLKALVKKHETE